MQSCLVSAMSCYADAPPNRISLFLNFQKTANFLFYFFSVYIFLVSASIFFFFKLRGLSSKSSSNRIQCCSYFLIIYCTFIFCITIIFSAYFSDMNYFVYFICLLCSTSLATTMLDSYDVSETLNNFFKIHCAL